MPPAELLACLHLPVGVRPDCPYGGVIFIDKIAPGAVRVELISNPMAGVNELPREEVRPIKKILTGIFNNYREALFYGTGLILWREE